MCVFLLKEESRLLKVTQLRLQQRTWPLFYPLSDSLFFPPFISAIVLLSTSVFC